MGFLTMQLVCSTHRPRTRRADQLHSQKSHRTRAQPRRHIGCPLQALRSIFTQRSIQPKMARTTLALLLASRAAALVPTLRTTSISKTISRVSYLSEVEDADKKKEVVGPGRRRPRGVEPPGPHGY